MPEPPPRQIPVVRDDDIVILRMAGVFEVHVGTHRTPERFSGFQGAAVRGEELARSKRVSLFYLDSPNEPPFMVRDYRR